MDTNEFFEKLTVYGANIEEIKKLFCGNKELYKNCFYKFLAEKEFTQLDDAMKNDLYEDAFSAAHTLKGLSGNLGLSPLFNAVSVLVEELRLKENEKARVGYNNVLSQVLILKRTFAVD